MADELLLVIAGVMDRDGHQRTSYPAVAGDVPPESDAAMERVLLLTVEEAAQRLRLGRSMVYTLIAQGRLTSVQIGRARRIPHRALVAFVENLHDEALLTSRPASVIDGPGFRRAPGISRRRP